MGLLNDQAIVRRAEEGMISPFEPEKIRKLFTGSVISYGLGSFGYDIRLGYNFKIANPLYPGAIDPKEPDPNAWIDIVISDPSSMFVLAPNSFCLAESIEHFAMPEDVLALVLGKSTYARSAVIANFTPLEPGWRGKVTIELGNLTKSPIYLYPGEGIAQVLFFEGEKPSNGYGDGLYQDQKGIVHSKV